MNLVEKWLRSFDERDISDEANHFADDAATTSSRTIGMYSTLSLPLPTNAGEMKAVLALAYEAGKRGIAS